MSDEWRNALAPTPECIDLARLGDELSEAERAHVDACVRCQTELALFREVMREESSPESQWIADQLQRRNNNVVPFAPRVWRALYAVAAVLVVVIGIGAWMQMREPSIDITGTPGTYRSARLDVVAPRGDIAQAPNELRWKTVPNATRYQVVIREVDATVLWTGGATTTHVVLPPDVVAQFAPGKSLQWDVRAFRGNEVLASSETQSVRVTP